MEKITLPSGSEHLFTYPPHYTVMTAFTELGGAEPLVEVLKGCEELSCSQYSALNNSTYPNTILYGGISSNH